MKRETSMVVPNFVDAAVGAIFSELLKAVLQEIQKANNFNSNFKRLESTLKRIRPVIVEIEKLDRRLGRSGDEIALFTRQLQEGLDLVRKCPKVCFRKNRYAEKLEAFERSLLQWTQIDVQLQLRRDTSKILLRLDGNRKGVMGAVIFIFIFISIFFIGGIYDNGIEFVGVCEVPGAPDFLVGLYEPLRESKAKLLDGGGEQVLVLVLCVPGGGEKTTLVKKLCSDEGIKDKPSSVPPATRMVRFNVERLSKRKQKETTEEEGNKRAKVILGSSFGTKDSAPATRVMTENPVIISSSPCGSISSVATGLPPLFVSLVDDQQLAPVYPKKTEDVGASREGDEVGDAQLKDAAI